MSPVIFSDCFGRSTSLPLQVDDLAGMATIYPPTPTAGPPGAPGGLSSAVSGSTVTIAWTAPSGGGAPLGYQLQAGSAAGLANYGAINTGGTSLVVPGVPNGVLYVRVVASNAAGSSAPTADHIITVGPVAPGAPRALSAVAGPGGSVAITWQPPASGGAPSNYVVLAGWVSGATTFQIPVSGTTLAGAGVPAAAYYVRVVALNAAGISPASTKSCSSCPSCGPASVPTNFPLSPDFAGSRLLPYAELEMARVLHTWGSAHNTRKLTKVAALIHCPYW